MTAQSAHQIRAITIAKYSRETKGLAFAAKPNQSSITFGASIATNDGETRPLATGRSRPQRFWKLNLKQQQRYEGMYHTTEDKRLSQLKLLSNPAIRRELQRVETKCDRQPKTVVKRQKINGKSLHRTQRCGDDADATGAPDRSHKARRSRRRCGDDADTTGACPDLRSAL